MELLTLFPKIFVEFAKVKVGFHFKRWPRLSALWQMVPSSITSHQLPTRNMSRPQLISPAGGTRALLQILTKIKQTLAILGGVKIEMYFRRASPPKCKNQSGHKNSQYKKDSNLGNLILELEFLFADCYSESLTRFLFFCLPLPLLSVFLNSSAEPTHMFPD